MTPPDAKTTMTIEPKRVVKQLATYQTMEDRRSPYIKLDMNENTAGFSEFSGFSKLDCSPNIYPEAYEVTEKLAEFLGVPKEKILLTNGSNEAISVVASTFIEPGEDVAVISKPCFFTILQCLLISGAKIDAIPVFEDLTFDIKGIERALQAKPKLAMFSSPDNPTGAILDGKKVLEWCSTYPETLFVIDEAYSEYCNYSLLPKLSEHGNLVLLKSLSKAWGLAGFRLGVILAEARLISYMDAVKLPYSVNSAALSAAKAILAHPKRIGEAANATMARKAGLIKSLSDRGYKIVEGSGNFFLLSVGFNCAEFTKFLKKRGILVRNLTPDIAKRDNALWGFVRISIGTEEENRKLIETIDAFNKSFAVIFDLDGTLVDTTTSFDLTVAEMVERYSGKPLPPKELRDLRAEGGFNNDWDAIAELLTRRGFPTSRRQIETEALETYFRLAPLNEKLMIELSLLQNLAKRHPLFIVTGRSRPEYDPLWGGTFDGIFRKVYCDGDCQNSKRKPAPDYLLKVLSDHGEGASAGAVYIGDSVDDMTAARLANMRRIGISSSMSAQALVAAGAELLLESPNDLARLFQI
jgi:histidinol-phosphate aminotransferase